MALLAAPIAMQAQTVTLFGGLSNFDVVNDTGQDAHGFEIELQGVASTSAPYTFNATRYGGSQTYPIPGGVLVRWASPYDVANQRFAITTALTCTVTMTADTAVTATFSGVVAPPPAATYKLVVKTNGNGKVTTNPVGTTFSAGTAVTLTAAPAAGVPWIGCAGACTGTSLTCTVTMNADATVTANFR